MQPGQWVLVQAAAGGVGLLLCQILRSVGAKVIGTASSEAKLQIAKENGAEWTVLSTDLEGLKKNVKEITGGHGVDVILDGVGGATFEADLEMIAIKGELVSFGNAVSIQSTILEYSNIMLITVTIHVVRSCSASKHFASR